MRRSDIFFLGTMTIMLIIVLISIIFDIELPDGATYYWWAFLSPYIVIKLFFRKSRIFKWFNTKIKF